MQFPKVTSSLHYNPLWSVCFRDGKFLWLAFVILTRWLIMRIRLRVLNEGEKRDVQNDWLWTEMTKYIQLNFAILWFMFILFGKFWNFSFEISERKKVALLYEIWFVLTFRSPRDSVMKSTSLVIIVLYEDIVIQIEGFQWNDYACRPCKYTTSWIQLFHLKISISDLSVAANFCMMHRLQWILDCS